MAGLTPDMIALIENFSAGAVASIDGAGRPAVSPKGTFVVINPDTIAFRDVRSPQTVENLAARPAVEVLFTDVLRRQGVRVAGTAAIVDMSSPQGIPLEPLWAANRQSTEPAVVITIEVAELIRSPAYDQGNTPAELIELHLQNLFAIATGGLEHTANHLGQPVGTTLEKPVAPRLPNTAPIEGRYCSIAPLSASDHASSLHAAYSAAADDGDWTYLPYGPFSDEGEFRQWLHSMEDLTDPLFFTIVDNVDGHGCGLAAYLRIDPRSGSIEVGHIHLARRMQRTAAATEAMYLMMKQAFECGFRRYEWKCDALNGPSRSAATRFGFRYEGTFRQATHYKGRNRDTAWYSILDNDWPALEEEYQRWLDPSNFDANGRQRSPLQCLP